MTINPFTLPITDAVYTFVNHDGVPVHIASDALLRALKRSDVVPSLCEFGDTLIVALEKGDLGVEEDHALSLPEAALETPLIVGTWGSKHIMIDGAHRLWRRWKRGDRDFNAYYVPEEAWRRFTIDGMPGSGAFWREHNRNSKVR